MWGGRESVTDPKLLGAAALMPADPVACECYLITLTQRSGVCLCVQSVSSQSASTAKCLLITHD